MPGKGCVAQQEEQGAFNSQVASARLVASIG